MVEWKGVLRVLVVGQRAESLMEAVVQNSDGWMDGPVSQVMQAVATKHHQRWQWTLDVCERRTTF